MKKMNKSLKRLNNAKGFTLVELVVVIVVIGILAAVAVPKLGGFSDTAKVKADVATAKTIATAAQTKLAEDSSIVVDDAIDISKLEDLLDTTSLKPQLLPDEAFSITVDNGNVKVLVNDVELYPNTSENYKAE